MLRGMRLAGRTSGTSATWLNRQTQNFAAPRPFRRSSPRNSCSGARRRSRQPPQLRFRFADLGPEAIGPRGTLAQTYLRSRALELPDEAANAAIRFHPACRFGNERMPAMVCLVRNIRTDEPQAIHRTALSPDGTAVKRNSKTFRMTLDPIADGAVKLDLDEDVTQGVCIAEGVETALASRQMGLRPVWALLGESGLASFPVLPGVDGLHIFREHDATNKRAAMACAGRWHEAGRDVFHVYPEIGSDLNDELLEATNTKSLNE
jgi:putative DNA primase/helicase